MARVVGTSAPIENVEDNATISVDRIAAPSSAKKGRKRKAINAANNVDVIRTTRSTAPKNG